MPRFRSDSCLREMDRLKFCLTSNEQQITLVMAIEPSRLDKRVWRGARVSQMRTRPPEQALPDKGFAEKKLDVLFCPVLGRESLKKHHDFLNISVLAKTYFTRAEVQSTWKSILISWSDHLTRNAAQT
jgi:hypothetical protein